MRTYWLLGLVFFNPDGTRDYQWGKEQRDTKSMLDWFDHRKDLDLAFELHDELDEAIVSETRGKRVRYVWKLVVDRQA